MGILRGKLHLEVKIGPGKMKRIEGIFNTPKGRNRVRKLGIFSVCVMNSEDINLTRLWMIYM